MIITIAGELGSGKSTVGKLLANKLNLKYFSTGQLMRSIAIEKNIDLLTLSKMAMKSDEIDKLLDKKQTELGKQDNIVVDSRLGWHFIPHATKIFFDIQPDEAAKRIFNANRDTEKSNSSIEATKQNILARKESERHRYKTYYGIDYDNKDNFDLIINTTKTTPSEVVERIERYLNSKTE